MVKNNLRLVFILLLTIINIKNSYETVTHDSTSVKRKMSIRPSRNYYYYWNFVKFFQNIINKHHVCAEFHSSRHNNIMLNIQKINKNAILYNILKNNIHRHCCNETIIK